MGRGERCVCETVAQEDDGMHGDEDDFVRIQPQPAATTSTAAVPSEQPFKGPISAGPILRASLANNSNAFMQNSKSQAYLRRLSRAVATVRSTYCRTSDSPVGHRRVCEPPNYQHGASHASLGHPDFQTQHSRASESLRLGTRTG